MIDIEVDPPVSFSVSVTASRPISGYRTIVMLILADVFVMVLSYPGCRGIQCLKLCDINKKERFGKAFVTQLHCLFI